MPVGKQRVLLTFASRSGRGRGGGGGAGKIICACCLQSERSLLLLRPASEAVRGREVEKRNRENKFLPGCCKAREVCYLCDPLHKEGAGDAGFASGTEKKYFAVLLARRGKFLTFASASGTKASGREGGEKKRGKGLAERRKMPSFATRKRTEGPWG